MKKSETIATDGQLSDTFLVIGQVGIGFEARIQIIMMTTVLSEARRKKKRCQKISSMSHLRIVRVCEILDEAP
jgi:hypothetical protein